MDSFYRAFEERYRGSRELIASRLEVYLPFVEPLKTLSEEPEILDLGCGRGEWLELMQRNGFRAKGVDLDEGMLLACRELNLDVCQADAIDYLRGLAADTMSVISAFQVVEHISFEALRQLVNEAHRVLKPGGLLILETPNSENLVVGSSTFYMDPTHQRPLPAQLLGFVVEYTGFARVKTLYLQESLDLATTQRISLFNVLEGVSPDYAIVAQKNATAEVFLKFDEPFERAYGIRLDSLATSYDQQTEICVTQAQWLQNEWDTVKQRIEELSKSTRQLETVQAQWLQNEWDTVKQRIEELSKNTRQLETVQVQWLQNEWDTAKQRIEELSKSTRQLEAVQVQWLQNEWDTAKQRIEELSKCTGQLEAELAAEQMKTINLSRELSGVNEHNNWLQNKWNAAKQQTEELSKNTRQLEAELATEQGKAINFALELNAANEHNIQLQAHAQWLQNELDAATAKVHELNHASHHWWTVADQLNQEKQIIYTSKFWRITWPLRKIMQAAKWTMALPARTVRWTLRLPKPIADRNATLANSHSYSTDSALQNPVATVYQPNISNESINTLSPRAASIYTELKKAIEARKN